MKRKHLRFGRGFRVAIADRQAQDRGNRHRNTGRGWLRTLNIYVPPAYSRRGDELPRARA